MSESEHYKHLFEECEDAREDLREELSRLSGEVKQKNEEIARRNKLIKQYQSEREQWRLQKKHDDSILTISVEKNRIPDGAELIEAYLHNGKLIVMGWPDTEEETSDDDPSRHNCDDMGCGSVGSHVVHIIKLDEHYRMRGLIEEASQVLRPDTMKVYASSFIVRRIRLLYYACRKIVAIAEREEVKKDGL